MRPIKSIQVILGSFFLTSIIFFAGCDIFSPGEESSEDKCGEGMNNILNLSNASINPETRPMFYDNGYRYYRYDIDPIQNVCPHKHIEGSFAIKVKSGSDISLIARADYAPLYSYVVSEWNLIENGDQTVTYESGNFDFGISYVYENDPGWFYPYLAIGVKEQATQEATNDYFKEVVKEIQWYFVYYEFKP